MQHVHVDDGLAIMASNVSVEYDLRLTPYRTFRQSVSDFFVRPRSRERDTRFWALRGVSFVLNSGETLGVIGRNGSGKSTLLLTLAGVIRPDRGLVDTFGRAPTLLTLATGFEPELTGRQNIFLQGAYFGWSRARMAERLDEIVEFSELGQFIDVPLRKYSSGMRVRLAFSIAAHVEPEILLLDEVLGVGDAGFLEKSSQKLRELIRGAQGIVVVSHNTAFIRKMCTKVMWLADGRVAAAGDPDEVVERYLASLAHVDRPVRMVS